MVVDDFVLSVERLVNQIGHWEHSRWATFASHPRAPRADVVHGLVQRLADTAADAEGIPRRMVPRPGDLILPDQLRVIADDLIAARASEDALADARTDVDLVRRGL